MPEALESRPLQGRQSQQTTRLCTRWSCMRSTVQPHPRVTFRTWLPAVERNVGSSPTARISGSGQTASIRSRWRQTHITRVPLPHLWLVVCSWPVGLQSFQPQKRAYTISACFSHPARPPAASAPPPARQPHRGHTLLAPPRPVAQSAERAAVACRDAARWGPRSRAGGVPAAPARVAVRRSRASRRSLGWARRCCLPVWGAVWGRGRGLLWLFVCRWPGARVCLWNRA